MGLFSSSRTSVNNTTTSNVAVSVDPTISVDIDGIAQAQRYAADRLGAGIGQAAQSAAHGVADAGRNVGSALFSGLSNIGLRAGEGVSNIALAIVGAGVLIAVASR